MRSGEAEVAKEVFCGAKKKTMNIWDVNNDNIIISNPIEIKNSFKYFDWICRWNYKTISFDIT